MRKLVRTVRNAFRYGEAGFTLIELLVVIGILAALAGVVTLAVTQFIGRGCSEAAKTELHNIQTAVAGCMVDESPAACATAYTDYLMTSPHGTYTVNASSGLVTQTAYAPCVP